MPTADLLDCFQIGGELLSIEPFGDGLINQTYLSTWQFATGNQKFIHQKINQNVFKKPWLIMENIAHAIPYFEGEPNQLKLVHSTSGQSYVIDEKYEVWRTYHFIKDSCTIPVASSTNVAYEAGRIVGWFQSKLIEMPVVSKPDHNHFSLHETIPNFHHTPSRISQFETALATDNHNRAQHCSDEIHYAQTIRDEMCELVHLQESGLLPLRATHNDTKLDNILFDAKSMKALCLVDLDTLMPGLSLYDLGDLARTLTNPVREDSTDLERVVINLDYFEAMVRGYLQEMGSHLLPEEIERIPLACQTISYNIGIRFLTDYLNGDSYFSTSYPQHNLDRARNQFALIKSMRKHESQMHRIVKKIIE